MANEIAATVILNSTGNYALVLNPANPSQAWDNNANGWATKDPTNTDQKIVFPTGTRVVEGSSDETQFVNLPTGLNSAIGYKFSVYDYLEEFVSPGSTYGAVINTGVQDIQNNFMRLNTEYNWVTSNGSVATTIE